MVSTDQAAIEAARTRAKADRARSRTLKNLVWALLACFSVIAFLAIVTWRPRAEEVRRIDYSAQLAEARRAAPYRVLAPDPMPQGWQATSAEVRAPAGGPVGWHLGVVTPGRRYVGLEQSNSDARGFLADRLGRTRGDGTSTVAGAGWQRRVLLDRDERAIVRSGPGVTTIVTGTADYLELEAFAASLD